MFGNWKARYASWFCFRLGDLSGEAVAVAVDIADLELAGFAGFAIFSVSGVGSMVAEASLIMP